jgi:NTP pyrophosphatase (non-canonical NTP hydrolase)
MGYEICDHTHVDAMARMAFNTSRDAGWHDVPNFDNLKRVLLIHSEVTELCEAIRRGTKDYVEVDGKPEGPASELADIVIRTLELAVHMGYEDFESVILHKMEYNRRRTDVPAHGYAGKAF